MSYNPSRPQAPKGPQPSGKAKKGSKSPAASARDKYRYVNVQKPGNNEQTKQELQDWARRAREMWDQRNVRFQRDQDLFNFATPGEAGSWSRNQNDLMILNDPRVVVKKMARIIARHPSVLEVVPNGPENTEIAQRVENYCYAVDQAVNHRWSAGLNNPYRYDQAFYACLRGWLCERILLFPEGEPDMSVDPAALYDDQLFDPAFVYPFSAGGEITRINHEYTATAEVIREDPLMYLADDTAVKYLADQSPTARITVQALYWQSLGTWYNAVLVGSEWLKEPVEIGYNPWIISITNGAAFRATPWDDQDYLRHIGTGILDENSETYKQLNRAATKLNALLSLEANPPVTLFTADGKSMKVDFSPGSRMFLTHKDKIEAHRAGPQIGDFKLLWDILNERKERGDIPGAFFADFTGGDSSAAQTVAMSAGRDVLYPFTESLNMHDQQRYHKMLVLYRDLGPGKPLRARSQPNALGIASSSEITAQDLESQGCYVEVTRSDMAPQEMIAKVNLGMALADKKVISLRELRGRNWVGLRNPDRENMQVLAEQVFLNEDVVKSLIPVALEGTGAPALAALLAGIQNGMPAPGSPQAPNGVPGAPAGQPPGLPASVMPPILGGNPMTNANMPPDIAQFNALAGMSPPPAFGGGGMGGIPPMPGPPNLPPLPMPPPGFPG